MQFPHDSDTSGGSFLADLMEEDEYECDDDDIYLTSPISQLPLHSTLSDSQFLENFQYSSQLYHEDKEVMPYTALIGLIYMLIFIHVYIEISDFLIHFYFVYFYSICSFIKN